MIRLVAMASARQPVCRSSSKLVYLMATSSRAFSQQRIVTASCSFLLRDGSLRFCLAPSKSLVASSRYRTFMGSSTSRSETTDTGVVHPEEILDKCANLYGSLSGLNDKFGGMAVAPPSDRATSLPFCLLVGNHSSGKSSFINYILGRNIQKAGVAPTDDTFTVIAPGQQDSDADGPTVVGNPDLGFGSLRQFGPTLIHHTQLKVRVSPLKFMLVDSPGMIDAPTNYYGTQGGGPSGGSLGDYKMDRGYDFQGVVRWLAQRADIVLLFFDPDKPGTTGETMSVLLNSLSGMDHKLLIVLNKADQFSKIHDFARAYGSLCWNLSKVIPRKDLPPIFTMCLPTSGDDNQKNRLSSSLSDLEHTRDDVVDQVMQAPKRRIDNVITNLYDSTSLLILYSKVWNDVASRYRKEWRQCRFQEVGWTTLGVLAVGGSTHFGLDPTYIGGMVGTSIVGVGGLLWYHQQYLKRLQEEMTSMQYLSTCFQRTHAREVQDADEFVASLWQRARESMQLSIQAGFDNNPSGLTPVSAVELKKLNDILNTEIPNLRRLASEASLRMRNSGLQGARVEGADVQ
jgi:hypothetical protein